MYIKWHFEYIYYQSSEILKELDELSSDTENEDDDEEEHTNSETESLLLLTLFIGNLFTFGSFGLCLQSILCIS